MIRKTPPTYRVRATPSGMVCVYHGTTLIGEAPTRAEALVLAYGHRAATAGNVVAYTPDVNVRLYCQARNGRRPEGRARWEFRPAPDASQVFAYRGLYARARNAAREHARLNGWTTLYLIPTP